MELVTLVVQGPTESVIRKSSDDGFHGTGLAALLDAGSVQRPAICGVTSEMCVSATARSALARGLDVVIPHDAHSTYDIEAVPGMSDAIPAAHIARAAEWALGAQVEIGPSTGCQLDTSAVIPNDHPITTVRPRMPSTREEPRCGAAGARLRARGRRIRRLLAVRRLAGAVRWPTECLYADCAQHVDIIHAGISDRDHKSTLLPAGARHDATNDSRLACLSPSSVGVSAHVSRLRHALDPFATVGACPPAEWTSSRLRTRGHAWRGSQGVLGVPHADAGRHQGPP